MQSGIGGEAKAFLYFRTPKSCLQLILIIFCSQIDNLHSSSLRLAYAIVALKHPPCHDKLTTIAPCKKPMEFIFCETGLSKGVQSQKPIKCFMSIISSKLARMDEI